MRISTRNGFGVGLGTLSLSPSQTQIAQMVVASANKYGVPPELALGIAQHESGFNAGAINTANSNGTKDWGVMQLNDVTVKTLGVANPLDPQQNIDAGVGLLAKYLQQYGGDTTKALWAYASGAGTVAGGGAMNATATQFVGYVEGYDAAPVINAIGSAGGTTTGQGGQDFESLAPTDSNTGLDSTTLTVGLIAAAALALFVTLK